jgi:uncharacterized protein YxjI
MHPALQRNMFFVKEHVGLFKAANNYDVLDPQTSQVVLLCREDDLGFFTRLLRFTDYKRMTPFDVRIKTPEGVTLVRVTRGVSLFVSHVKVMDEHDRVVGGFRQKFFSIGGRFTVFGAQDQPVCTLQGNWTGWDFKFVSGGTMLAQVAKKWAGLGKELFTSADNYMLTIADNIRPDDPRRLLLLAAVMSIDMVLKE